MMTQNKSTYVEPAREIRVVKETDVIVVGGGPGGVASAVCAARNGARTVLIERYGHLGGMATGGLVNIIPHCICYGQAAGTAAAMAAKAGIQPRNVNYKSLQKNLTNQGVNIPRGQGA